MGDSLCVLTTAAFEQPRHSGAVFHRRIVARLRCIRTASTTPLRGAIAHEARVCRSECTSGRSSALANSSSCGTHCCTATGRFTTGGRIDGYAQAAVFAWGWDANRIADMVLANRTSPPNIAGTRERWLHSLQCIGTSQTLTQHGCTMFLIVLAQTHLHSVLATPTVLAR